jgi:hypothetical protein
MLDIVVYYSLEVKLRRSKRCLKVCIEKDNLCEVEVNTVGVSFLIYDKLNISSLAMKSVLKGGIKNSLSFSQLCLLVV